MSDPTKNIWPNSLMIRDTQLHDDLGGGGQRIYTTAGRGYEKRKYIRADRIEQLSAENERLKSRGIEDMKFEIEQLSAENIALKKIAGASREVMDIENDKGQAMNRLFSAWNDWFEKHAAALDDDDE